MRRITILLLVALSFCINVSNAQLIKSYGLKLAYTSASQTFEYSNPPKPNFELKALRRTGFNIGAFVEWFNLPFISAISQIEYAQRGVGPGRRHHR